MSLNLVSRPALRPIAGRFEQSCRWCRSVEPNDFLMGNNHYPDMGLRVGHCIGQHLLRNHVSYAVGRLTSGACDRHGNLRPLPGGARESERKHLAERIERAAVLWGHRDDAGFLDEARAILDAEVSVTVPAAHADVAASEEVSLW
jgi:hypothetical protein